ncbi:ATP-binding protein [Kitasatospora purpeofusca]|uniref:ATP-binding protein n=1 Tax=Kitasatospora purpeofusca TaxID=67352 RepID=UPI0022591BFE|nr:ATP-binding protein [Kitasatospora purpeofusca]MCX4756886.1 ATP-binding protein [Kitasatospora purpeofusca]WSR35338.1 ATP-binding protein [Kitasatospora purpeofusca]WSR43658.1 ATP-binding protein [Kitasatospora purpeofusca]
MTLTSNAAGGGVALRRATRPATVSLPYRPESVAAARCCIRAKLHDWGLDELVDDASVVVSELATNAVRTGCRTRMIVAVRRPAEHLVRLLVVDGSGAMPVMIEAESDATSGRGLAIVHRLTHGRWGVTLLPFGKIVHADLVITR